MYVKHTGHRGFCQSGWRFDDSYTDVQRDRPQKAGLCYGVLSGKTVDEVLVVASSRSLAAVHQGAVLRLHLPGSRALPCLHRRSGSAPGPGGEVEFPPCSRGGRKRQNPATDVDRAGHSMGRSPSGTDSPVGPGSTNSHPLRETGFSTNSKEAIHPPMNPDIQSPPKTRADCVESGSRHAYAIGIESDDGQAYWLSSAQFLSFVYGPNPDRSHEPGVPPERGVLRFGNAEVTVHGSGFARVGHLLSDGNLNRLRSLPWRVRDPSNRSPWIASVNVTLTPDL